MATLLRWRRTRAALGLAALLALVTANGCGGQSSGGSESASHSGAAGSGGAGTSGGSAERGGSGGGGAGTIGSGGTAGGAAGNEQSYASAGEDGYFDPVKPLCCADDEYCGKQRRCINHLCVTDNPYGCWLDDQCAPGELCSGVFLCACATICERETALGTCVPSDAGCCRENADCPQGGTCAKGRCMPVVPPDGSCWTNSDCAEEGGCVHATVCPCGAECTEPDVPGTCSYRI